MRTTEFWNINLSTRVLIGEVHVIISNVSRSTVLLEQPVQDISATYDQGISSVCRSDHRVLVSSSMTYHHGFLTTVTRRLLLVYRIVLTIQEYSSLPLVLN